MMTSLYTAQSGLKVSRYAIDSVSNNISNKDTEGYLKRTTESSEKYSNNLGIGTGVSFDGVSRTTNEYLFSKIIDSNSQSNYYIQKDDTLSNAELIFKESEDSGLSNTLNSVYSSIENLRSEPTSTIYSTTLENDVKTLVKNMQSIYSELNNLNEDNKLKLNSQTSKVNDILEQISKINEKMEQNGKSNDLLDKRDGLEKELSAYVDVDVDTQDDNYILSIGNQTAVFNTSFSANFEVKEEYIKQRDVYTSNLDDSSLTNGDPITVTLNNGTVLNLTANTTATAGNTDVKQQIINAINTNSDFNGVEASLDTAGNLIIEAKNGGEDDIFDISISVNGTEVSKDSDISISGENKIYLASNDEKVELTGGSVKALTESLTTSTSEISDYKKQLNDFSKAFVETFNNASSNNLFKGSSVESFEYIENSVKSLTPTDLESLKDIQWNNNINIDSNSTETASFADFYKNLLTKVSSNVERNETDKTTESTLLNSLTETYQQLTKVDNDEELINLMAFQKTYEANAKIISAVDEMLQTILKM